jgi:predicted RNA binding protein YcfA (HicA-like mRNA interferase family)
MSQGAFNNVRFDDACRLVEGFGFVLARVRGSHHVFAHPTIPELINLQDAKGQAKPYQLRQLLRIVERYNLKLEADE